MVNDAIDTIDVNGVFMVDRRVNKVNTTRCARRSTDEKPAMELPGYHMIGLNQLGRIIDIKV